MRLLAVGNMYPPQSFGGYEIVWRAAVGHLRSRGHEVRVLTTDLGGGPWGPDDPDVHRELRWYWRDHEFPPQRLPVLVATERHNARVLARHLADLRPEAVTWWHMAGMSLSLMEQVRRRGLPAVAFVHNDWLDFGRQLDWWTRFFGGPWVHTAPLAERLTGVPARVDLARAARYVFVSDHVRRHALATIPDLADTAVAHSGIDPAFLVDPREPAEWRWRLLYVGRIDPDKGVDTAIDALTHLPAEARLEIVGSYDPREERRLRARTVELGVEDRVRFAGKRPNGELPAVYDAADAVVFPSRWAEPWGLVPLEAMARGRPVVATGTGGSAEYLREGGNCLLFAPGDAPALARAVERLAGDAALRDRLRAGGLEMAARHTSTVFNEAVEAEILRAGARR